MKLVILFLCFSILFGGCARKSEMDEARINLAEAQRRIEALENERVSRSQYEATQASLKQASERITALEAELKLAQAQAAALENATAHSQPASLASVASQSPATEPPPAALGLARGAYVLSNETYVYSQDSQLNFGNHLQISSPTGLMVSDPEQKIVGGDLSIKAKGMMLETNDGLLTTAADGSVKFTGKSLTMKFDEANAPHEVQSDTSSSPPTPATADDIPASPQTAPATTAAP